MKDVRLVMMMVSMTGALSAQKRGIWKVSLLVMSKETLLGYRLDGLLVD
jgi:hypothetical protein